MEEFWEINGKALDYTRNTSYYSHFIAGFQKLYDFDDLYFTSSNIIDLSEPGFSFSLDHSEVSGIRSSHSDSYRIPGRERQYP